MTGETPYTPNIRTDSKTSTGLRLLHDEGEPVRDKGVYLGIGILPPKFGIELPPQAHFWAAPEDLKIGNWFTTPDAYTYSDAFNGIASLKDFHGRNGIKIPHKAGGAPGTPDEHSLYVYLKDLASDRSVKEGWVMGTIEIVGGWSADNSTLVNLNSLFRSVARMPYDTRPKSRYSSHSSQWTCTALLNQPNIIHTVNFDERRSAPHQLSVVSDKHNARPVCISFER